MRAAACPDESGPALPVNAFGLFAGNIENDAEARFATHHAVVRLGRFFQRKNFVHGMYVRRRTKFECVLRIDGGT